MNPWNSPYLYTPTAATVTTTTAKDFVTYVRRHYVGRIEKAFVLNAPLVFWVSDGWHPPMCKGL